jgi:hypothetical protein
MGASVLFHVLHQFWLVSGNPNFAYGVGLFVNMAQIWVLRSVITSFDALVYDVHVGSSLERFPQ